MCIRDRQNRCHCKKQRCRKLRYERIKNRKTGYIAVSHISMKQFPKQMCIRDRNITVYLGALEGNDPALGDAVRELGTWIGAVSYTHLDVYKRQGLTPYFSGFLRFRPRAYSADQRIPLASEIPSEYPSAT